MLFENRFGHVHCEKVRIIFAGMFVIPAPDSVHGSETTYVLRNLNIVNVCIYSTRSMIELSACVCA